MAIISRKENNHIGSRYGSTQVRYALTYVLITFVVLLFLNIYTSSVSQRLFYESKSTPMIERCQLTATEIAKLDVVNTSTISNALDRMTSFQVSRLIVTDHTGVAIYDSFGQAGALGKYVLFPEVVTALGGNDVFTWSFESKSGAMYSRAATPIISYGQLTGCVYMIEADTAQGILIQSLQSNVLWVTLVLELVLLAFSVLMAKTFSKRLTKIMTSMRIIREGDYSHKVEMGGNDELTVLGQEFNDLTERLQISEQKRRQFVSDASHELKTPLASIKLLSDSILQNDMDTETVREFVSDIGNEADRLNRMSQKLLNLTKIESQLDAECEIICFLPTIQRVVKMLTVIAQENDIRILVDIQTDSPILILEDDLYQIIFNLAENGIKYNVPGGTLTIRLTREQENAILQVSDTGMGIPEDAIGHVFERFYRVDKARSRKSGGSGLGLAIVRNLVERHRGEISLESALGKGTVFTVSFPVFDMEEDAQ